MARYLGPKAKLSRREGTDLFLKSARRSIGDKAQVRLQARPARPHLGHAHVGLRPAAAREAEGQAHVRHARAPVPPLLRRSRRAARATPARTCCACSSRAWTTSSTAWASARRAPKRASSCRTSAITVNGEVVNIAVVPGQGRRRRRRAREGQEAAASSRPLQAGRAGRACPTGSRSTPTRLEGMFKKAPDRDEFGADIKEA